MIENIPTQRGQVITVLDIDLDFFLSKITEIARRSCGQRQDKAVKPWSEFAVREFLEKQCKLIRSNPCPGIVVKMHDEVFWSWKSLIVAGHLPSQFDVVHVDAHADLGMGYPSPSISFICTELLNYPVEHRLGVEFNGFDEGSYLAFALACRWISRLTYVHHPHLNLKNGDVPSVHLKGFVQSADAIQLKRYQLEDLKRNFWRYQDTQPLMLEPEVPFSRVPGSEYLADHSPDFLFVAQSPSYTPESADMLLEVIREYVRQI